MRRYKQQEFSFESFHVKLMYVDRLFFLLLIPITVGVGGGGLFISRTFEGETY